MKTPISLEQAVRRAIALAIADQPRHVVGIGRECLWQFVASHLVKLLPRGNPYSAKQLYRQEVTEGRWCKFVYDDRQPQRRD